MAGHKLFERQIIVEIGVKGQPAQRYEGLRVKFHVEQTPAGTPNKGKIEVYNLSRQSAAVVEKPGSMVRLIAGYKGHSEVIYTGDISPKTSKTELDGTDYVTRMECADGIDVYQNASVEKSYAEGTPYKDVLTEVAQSMQEIGMPSITGVPDESVLGGLTLFGLSQKSMTDLTKKLGLDWSIQDAVVQVTKKGGATNDSAVLLSPQTGLVGIPKRKDDNIELTSLLQPSIRPGRQIELQSRRLNGRYIASKVIHTGDNFDKDFYTIIEAKKYE